METSPLAPPVCSATQGAVAERDGAIAARDDAIKNLQAEMRNREESYTKTFAGTGGATLNVANPAAAGGVLVRSISRVFVSAARTGGPERGPPLLSSAFLPDARGCVVLPPPLFAGVDEGEGQGVRVEQTARRAWRTIARKEG